MLRLLEIDEAEHRYYFYLDGLTPMLCNAMVGFARLYTRHGVGIRSEDHWVSINPFKSGQEPGYIGI